MKARPLKNLCEHEGRRLPADYKSDCYNDVDEGDYACNEKKRILVGTQCNCCMLLDGVSLNPSSFGHDITLPA